MLSLDYTFNQYFHLKANDTEATHSYSDSLDDLFVLTSFLISLKCGTGPGSVLGPLLQSCDAPDLTNDAPARRCHSHLYFPVTSTQVPSKQ